MCKISQEVIKVEKDEIPRLAICGEELLASEKIYNNVWIDIAAYRHGWNEGGSAKVQTKSNLTRIIKNKTEK